jgi:hypothetical protein
MAALRRSSRQIVEAPRRAWVVVASSCEMSVAIACHNRPGVLGHAGSTK